MGELLVGTRKGLFVLRKPRGGGGKGAFEIVARAFPGEVVEFAMRDRRGGRYLAGVTHGQFGPHLFYAENPAGAWQQAEGPAFPTSLNVAVERIWVIEPGVGDGELWCGVAPAATEARPGRWCKLYGTCRSGRSGTQAPAACASTRSVHGPAITTGWQSASRPAASG
jgi:hypothetical protein